MKKSIVCGECFRAAFVATDGSIHHGTEDCIDQTLDADHAAYDVEDDFRAHGGPERMLARLQAADDALATFDFGDLEVSVLEEWQGVTPGTDLFCILQTTPHEGAAPEQVRLVVRFRDAASAEVASVFLQEIRDTPLH